MGVRRGPYGQAIGLDTQDVLEAIPAGRRIGFGESMADGDGTSGEGDAVGEGDGLSDGEGVFDALVEVVVTAAGVAHAPSSVTSATGANVGRNLMAAIVLIPLCGKTAGSGPCSRSAALSPGGRSDEQPV